MTSVFYLQSVLNSLLSLTRPGHTVRATQSISIDSLLDRPRVGVHADLRRGAIQNR
jgi:hypothetical protein